MQKILPRSENDVFVGRSACSHYLANSLGDLIAPGSTIQPCMFAVERSGVKCQIRLREFRLNSLRWQKLARPGVLRIRGFNERVRTAYTKVWSSGNSQMNSLKPEHSPHCSTNFRFETFAAQFPPVPPANKHGRIEKLFHSLEVGTKAFVRAKRRKFDLLNQSHASPVMPNRAGLRPRVTRVKRNRVDRSTSQAVSNG